MRASGIVWIDILNVVIVCMLLLALLSIVYRSWRNGISPMPASAPVRRQTAELLRQLRAGGTLVEAGSGWGTLLLHLARHCPGWTRMIGIENSIVPYMVSRAMIGWGRLLTRPRQSARIAVLRTDLYAHDYTEADAVVCYLYPGAMDRLGPILAEQLKPGSYVLSICFAIPGWKPERVALCRDLYRTPIYCYRVG